MGKEFINIPFSQANTSKESEMLEVIQYLADIINSISPYHMEEAREKLDEMRIYYTVDDDMK